MIYETCTPEARDLARVLWENGARELVLMAPTIKARITPTQMRYVNALYPEVEWQLSVYQDFANPLWTPVGDTAYYNGLLFGAFGYIGAAYEDGIMIMYHNTLGTVTSDQWKWVPQNQYWAIDLIRDKPLIVP